MNAPIRPRNLMELLQQNGCTLLDGKRPGGLEEAGNGGARRGLDDDQSRHDEPGALRFMDLCPNNAKRNLRRDDAVREIAWIKTALGPNREEHRDKVCAWYCHSDWPDNDEDKFNAIWDSIKDSERGIDGLRERCPELALDYANELFADPVPPEYLDDAPPVAPVIPQPTAFSHDALAVEFADLHAEDLRFAAPWGKWFEWSVDRWRPDEKLHVMTLARPVCRQAAQQAFVLSDNQRMQLVSAGTIAAVVNLARCDERLAIAIDEFDRDPWLLNTPGGTVELKTGRMREHRRPDYITKVAAVTPGGACPQWDAFIDRITGHDRELAAFIQRMLGYALTAQPKSDVCSFSLDVEPMANRSCSTRCRASLPTTTPPRQSRRSPQAPQTGTLPNLPGCAARAL